MSVFCGFHSQLRIKHIRRGTQAEGFSLGPTPS
jgi:hypothetical protein